MNYSQFEKDLNSKDLIHANLIFLCKEDTVLLAMKKRGFGKNLFNGVGGKPDVGERMEESAIREAKEEIDVEIQIKDLQKVGEITFLFPYLDKSLQFNHQVTVYITTKWQNEPKETEEMRPEWFDIDKIPLDRMWDDDKYWLPQVLLGEKIRAKFWFDKNQKVEKMEIKSLDQDSN